MADARSCQSSSTGSSPTLSRSSPGGTRSGSHRCLVSIVESTPPRLVALTIRRVEVSTRRAASPSSTSKESRPPKPGYRTVVTRGCSPSRRASSCALAVWRSTRSSERLQAPEEQPRGVRPGGRTGAVRGTRGGGRRPRAGGRRPRRGGRRGGRRGTSSRSGGRGRSRARAGAGAREWPRSRRRRPEPGAPQPPRSRASSAAGSRAPRPRRGRPRGVGRSGRRGRAAGPSAPARRRRRRCRSRRPRRGRRSSLPRAARARSRRPPPSRRRRGRLAAVELPERALGLGAGRVPRPGVVEGARLAVLEGPDRRAVERRLHQTRCRWVGRKALGYLSP